jgi:hypothetical protein
VYSLQYTYFFSSSSETKKRKIETANRMARNPPTDKPHPTMIDHYELCFERKVKQGRFRSARPQGKKSDGSSLLMRAGARA